MSWERPRPAPLLAAKATNIPCLSGAPRQTSEHVVQAGDNYGGPERAHIFAGGGFGGGGEVGFTVGPAWEVNTASRVGFRTFATAGGGDIVGGAVTMQAGSNGVMASGGVGLVDGLLAETGYGVDFNFPLDLEGSLCP